MTSRLNDWLQLLGFIGVIGGLVFVGLQLQQDREIASVASTEDARASMLTWAELVAENPAVWAKGLSGEELSEEQWVAFNALARALDMHYFASWNKAKRMDSETLANRFVREAAYDYYISPGLTRFPHFIAPCHDAASSKATPIPRSASAVSSTKQRSSVSRGTAM